MMTLGGVGIYHGLFQTNHPKTVGGMGGASMIGGPEEDSSVVVLNNNINIIPIE